MSCYTRLGEGAGGGGYSSGEGGAGYALLEEGGGILFWEERRGGGEIECSVMCIGTDIYTHTRWLCVFTDADECTTSHHCYSETEQCVNTIGSYNCRCSPGKPFDEILKRCVGKSLRG